MNEQSGTLRIGTRGSQLARTQTEWVAAQLTSRFPHLEIAIEIIQTTGDARRDVPFAAVGTKGMFVKEIEQALLNGTIDMGVHSLKDMPSELPDGLTIACIPAREDARDALISRTGQKLSELPHGATVGTSSLRRQAFLKEFRPDLNLQELRGNLDTRLRKLDEGLYDAIVLACAGLNRLGLAYRIAEAIDPLICVPAVGQGALAVETRTADTATTGLLAALHDADTADCIAAERAFLAALGGGCSVPAGAYAVLEDSDLVLLAAIAAPDGSKTIRESGRGSRAQAHVLGTQIAETLLRNGGASLLKG